jgi:hypothetical protein
VSTFAGERWKAVGEEWCERRKYIEGRKEMQGEEVRRAHSVEGIMEKQRHMLCER